MPKDEDRRRLGVLLVTPRLVVDLLKIPEEYKFRGAFYDFDSNTFRLKFQHPDFPLVEDGYPAPIVEMDYETRRLS